MNADADRAGPSSGEEFLDLLGDPGRRVIDCGGVMTVFAHPDDETIAMGGQLSRLSGIRLLHVTDGAPASMTDALANGFSRREAYAAARKVELADAVDQAGIPREALLTLGAIDQMAAFRMPVLANLLCSAFRWHATMVVITHAFEGGHPDHDAAALTVHAACLMRKKQGARAPDVVECPLYHARDGKWIPQEFARPPQIAARELIIDLDGEAAESKRRMLSAHRTQHRTLAPFAFALERFRTAPRYDFSQLPNGGDLLYEQFDWGVDGQAWLRLAGEARRQLGLPRWF